MKATLASGAGQPPGPAPEPHPDYARWSREFALLMIRDGHAPADFTLAGDAGYIGGIIAELAAGGTGPREAAVLLRRMRSGLTVIDGGGESAPGPRPALRLVRR